MRVDDQVQRPCPKCLWRRPICPIPSAGRRQPERFVVDVVERAAVVGVVVKTVVNAQPTRTALTTTRPSSGVRSADPLIKSRLLSTRSLSYERTSCRTSDCARSRTRSSRQCRYLKCPRDGTASQPLRCVVFPNPFPKRRRGPLPCRSLAARPLLTAHPLHY